MEEMKDLVHRTVADRRVPVPSKSLWRWALSIFWRWAISNKRVPDSAFGFSAATGLIMLLHCYAAT
jgi:hypothetical protein